MVFVYLISRYLPTHQLRRSHLLDNQGAITLSIASPTKMEITNISPVRKEITMIIDSPNNQLNKRQSSQSLHQLSLTCCTERLHTVESD